MKHVSWCFKMFTLNSLRTIIGVASSRLTFAMCVVESASTSQLRLSIVASYQSIKGTNSSNINWTNHLFSILETSTLQLPTAITCCSALCRLYTQYPVNYRAFHLRFSWTRIYTWPSHSVISILIEFLMHVNDPGLV